MKLTLEIKDSKFKTFCEFIKTLDYVTISKEENMPQWQKDEEQQRLEDLDKDEMGTRNWDGPREDLFRKE